MTSHMPAKLARALAAIAVCALVAVLLYTPAPWSGVRILYGTVLRVDVIEEARFHGGARASLMVHLSDGSVVSVTTSRATMPAVSSLVMIEERHGVFGQRLVTRR